MAHQRIRKFNTAKMYPGKGMDNDLCMAVRAGNRVGIGDPAAQAEMAMQCVKTLLEESGAKLEHICKTTIYITDRAYREEVYTVIGRWLKGIHPCSTGLIVQGLARPEMVMEIDVEAIIPEADA
jgi:enamine deaminase RidA (YjgF/YER057c/UK114 family)